jgi:hypothetical protein
VIRDLLHIFQLDIDVMRDGIALGLTDGQWINGDTSKIYDRMPRPFTSAAVTDSSDFATPGEIDE